MTVQWDNAGGHGVSNLMSKIADKLPAPMRRGKQVGPEIKVADQCAQSPDTNGCDLGFNNSLDSRLPRVRDFDLDKFEEQIL